MGFDAGWLEARAPYDEAALDREAMAAIQAWGANLPPEHVPVVVDLGSGTGAALRRVHQWLAPRPIRAFAVDQDASLLARIAAPDDGSTVTRIVGDCLGPLDTLGGPRDGSVDLVVGHALADLLPLDRLAERVAALLRPGGLAHLALSYDGLTSFRPAHDLDAPVLAAFHRAMDRNGRTVPHYGGSTAGRRVGPALTAAGLEILVDAPSVWQVHTLDRPVGAVVLRDLLQFVTEAVARSRDVGPRDLGRWLKARGQARRSRTLEARVEHRDVLARKPIS